jgi:hypothetical protein
MALGSSKEIEFLNRENDLLRQQVADLKEEKKELARRLDNMSNALIARQSPDAYQDMKAEEYDAEHADRYDDEHRKKLIKAGQTLLDATENPLFKDADDMQAMILGNLISESTSTHDNEES